MMQFNCSLAVQSAVWPSYSFLGARSEGPAMTGLHHFQNSPASTRSAAPFESANLPEAGSRGGRADAAAAVLRHRFEALAAQIAELEEIRQKVAQAEDEARARGN